MMAGIEKSMADFVQNSQTKSAIRELADPIADVATFNTIVQSVITDNPFACVSYMTAGVTHDPVEKTKEGYAVKIIYQDYRCKGCRQPVGQVQHHRRVQCRGHRDSRQHGPLNRSRRHSRS